MQSFFAGHSLTNRFNPRVSGLPLISRPRPFGLPRLSFSVSHSVLSGTNCPKCAVAGVRNPHLTNPHGSPPRRKQKRSLPDSHTGSGSSCVTARSISHSGQVGARAQSIMIPSDGPPVPETRVLAVASHVRSALPAPFLDVIFCFRRC